MAVGMVVTGAALGWCVLAAALAVGHPVWLALLAQSGLGAGLVLIWAGAMALRTRGGGWIAAPVAPWPAGCGLRPVGDGPVPRAASRRDGGASAP